MSGREVAPWFAERRFGMFVHMSIASVPAFAPVHEYTEWYWSHLSAEPLEDVILHPAPMPEVQDWHDRHHRGRSYDDFIGDLTMDRWDADAVAELAVDAGMGYVVHTSKHHDGYCFFDSALTDRTTVRSGPGRDVVGELAEASRRAGLVYGLYYSLLDWSHPAYGDDAYVTDYLHPQVLELVERYAPQVLWGDGRWGRSPAYWRSDELMERCLAAGDGDIVVNDWGDRRIRYTVTPSDDGDLHLNVIDLAAASEVRLDVLGAERYELVRTGGCDLELHDRGATLRPATRDRGLATVSQLVLRPRPGPVVVDDGSADAARIGGRAFATIGEALDAARPGEVVEVLDGRFASADESFPLQVRAGVELRGHADAVLVIDADGPAVEIVGGGGVVRGLTVRSTSPGGFGGAVAGIGVEGADAVVTGCRLRRCAVVATGADRVRIEDNELVGGAIVVSHGEAATVGHNRQGGGRWGPGVSILHSPGATVHDNSIRDDLAGVRVVDSEGCVITANEIAARWWGVHLDRSTDSSAAHNTIRTTMRAVCITAGGGHHVLGNTITRCDSAVLVEAGAADVSVLDNTIVDCRLDVVVHQSPAPRTEANRVLRPRLVEP